LIARPFAPRPWTTGGHRQTLLGYLRRRRLRWTAAAEDRVIESGQDARILVRASWQPGERADRPALLLIHGLGGSDRGAYVVATGLLAWQRGFHVVRMNMRGAGAGEGVCPRLYNAGLDGDVVAVLERLAPEVSGIVVVGFSLGGSLALLALARNGPRMARFVRAVATVSAPLDLAACAAALERPANRLYQVYFMRELRRAYRRLQRRSPELYAPGRERGLRTVLEYDEAITAPYGGYSSAADYYARSSAGPRLVALIHPGLLLSAADDPMVPAESNSRWALPASGHVVREVWPTGGHVGFVAPTSAPGRFWAAERVVSFAEDWTR
jgi:predicted alpha/beta-fold hydrolase